MTFWSWYWTATGLFCWGVFGAVAFMIVGEKLLDGHYRSKNLAMVLAIILCGPFVWLMGIGTFFCVLVEWFRDRKLYGREKGQNL